jgi:hypothetical protein
MRSNRFVVAFEPSLMEAVPGSACGWLTRGGWSRSNLLWSRLEPWVLLLRKETAAWRQFLDLGSCEALECISGCANYRLAPYIGHQQMVQCQGWARQHLYAYDTGAPEAGSVS